MHTESKWAVTTTVGYMCLALAGWMISMPNASWFSTLYQHGQTITYPLSIILVVMGILSFLQSRTLDAIIFFGGSGLLWADYCYFITVKASSNEDPRSYTGWYAFIWAVFFCYVWFGSFKSGIFRVLFLLGLWLTLLALAIGDWANLRAISVLGGYLGLVTSILAAITSAIAVISQGMKTGDAKSESA